MTLVPTKEYTSAAEIIAARRALRAQFYAKPAPKKPKEQRVELVQPESGPQPDPLAQYRLAYDNALDPRWDVQIAKRVLREAAAEHGFTVAEITGASRRAPLAFARQIAIWRIAKMTNLSMPHIGMIVGGKDHTTVLHSIRRINEALGENVRGVGNVWRGKKRP